MTPEEGAKMIISGGMVSGSIDGELDLIAENKSPIPSL